jgi:hypothetical protein
MEFNGLEIAECFYECREAARDEDDKLQRHYEYADGINSIQGSIETLHPTPPSIQGSISQTLPKATGDASFCSDYLESAGARNR